MLTLIALTRLAVLFATSFADETKCRLATGLVVFDDAIRQVLHKTDVCLAMSVAADSTCHSYIEVLLEHQEPYLLQLVTF
jgi:hypothetical protein